jgi:hypothetical protein
VPTDFLFPETEDAIHDVATLLKRYFKEMKNPVLTHSLYKQFIACEGIYCHYLRILFDFLCEFTNFVRDITIDCKFTFD